MTSRVDQQLGKAVIAAVRKNQELRQTLQMPPLRQDVLRKAVERHGGAYKGARALLAVAQRENERLQARVDAGDRGPDSHGRTFGHPNYGKRLSDAQWEQLSEGQRILQSIGEHMSTIPQGPRNPYEDEKPPSSYEEALAQLDKGGLLAPEGSQLIDSEGSSLPFTN